MVAAADDWKFQFLPLSYTNGDVITMLIPVFIVTGLLRSF
jgi:hypothetical protein